MLEIEHHYLGGENLKVIDSDKTIKEKRRILLKRPRVTLFLRIIYNDLRNANFFFVLIGF